MNRIILIFALFFSLNIIQAQSDKNKTEKKSSLCENAKKVAEKDISNGKIKKFIMGDGRNLKLEYVLNNEYNIQTEYIGCLPSQFEICYNEIMDEVIVKKYGNKIYTKATKKAKKLKIKDLERKKINYLQQ